MRRPSPDEMPRDWLYSAVMWLLVLTIVAGTITASYGAYRIVKAASHVVYCCDDD
jgi:hypothetical protein